ncbi:MAG: MFS transporter [Caedibacter sp. 38-128]|nr:DHA2 family efflux MFS transporter permease subunit [Holosporales bacterium]OJX05880.1 MAG: MFS transporter [Caedibacter sp. 38-128]
MSQNHPNKVSSREWSGFIAMAFGMFMAILDIQIVSSSLSEIQAGISASADEISWVQTSYLIAEVIMIPLSGYLSRIFSTRVIFCLSCLGFTLMSLLCSFAWNIESMIFFRALQGFVGGAMIPTVFAAGFIMFPPRLRPTVGVIVGLVATLAPTLGPTLGGYLTQIFSWQWLFLINIVPGIIVTALVWLLVNIDKPNFSLLKRFDILGALSMATFLGSLEYILEEGPREGWFDDTMILFFTGVMILAGLSFFWRVLTYQEPIVDLKAFTDRNFSIGCFYSFTIGIGLYGTVYLIPLFLARIRGYNSLQIGELMMVAGLFQFVAAPIGGQLLKRIDMRYILAFGIVLFFLSIHLSSALTNQASFDEYFWPQALRGIAIIFCFLPINNLALGTLPPERLKNASGLYNLMRNLGGAIGLALINTILIRRLDLHKARILDNLKTGKIQLENFLYGLETKFADLNIQDGNRAALKNLSNLVEREAGVQAFNDCYIIMGWLFGASFLLIFLLRKPDQTFQDKVGH